MMAKLIYSAIASLDGYIEDDTGNFDWAVPDDEAHKYINESERWIGAYLYGRRMYETMAVWETDVTLGQSSPIAADYARIWQSADKIVYSRTLEAATTARTSIERRFEPEAVRRLLESAQRDVSIGGPELAAHALKAGLVDEYHLYVAPVIIGGGKPCLPREFCARLELLDERRFAGGIVYLRYRIVK